MKTVMMFIFLDSWHVVKPPVLLSTEQTDLELIHFLILLSSEEELLKPQLKTTNQEKPKDHYKLMPEKKPLLDSINLDMLMVSTLPQKLEKDFKLLCKNMLPCSEDKISSRRE
jgi:hypothetical protein